MPRWSPFEPYFWSQVDKTETCWNWTGNRYSCGYGRVHYQGRRHPAHRVSYRLVVGEIPNGLFVCHHCDNKLCVNPKHLFIGTQKDNMQDWTKKGLNKALSNGTLSQRGDDHWTRKPSAQEWKDRISRKLKEELRDGIRTVIRDDKGRILGHRRITCHQS